MNDITYGLNFFGWFIVEYLRRPGRWHKAIMLCWLGPALALFYANLFTGDRFYVTILLWQHVALLIFSVLVIIQVRQLQRTQL